MHLLNPSIKRVYREIVQNLFYQADFYHLSLLVVSYPQIIMETFQAANCGIIQSE